METKETKTTRFNAVRVVILANFVKENRTEIMCIMNEPVVVVETACAKMSNDKVKYTFAPVYEQTLVQFLQYNPKLVGKIEREVERRRKLMAKEPAF